MMTKIEVIGRNGYIYPAEYLSGNLYIVGKFIVIAEETGYGGMPIVNETVCKATRANVTHYMKRNQLVG